MEPISVVLTSNDHASDDSIRRFYLTHELVDGVIEQPGIFSGEALNGLLAAARTEYILFVLPGGKIEWSTRGLDRLYQVAKSSRAGLVYCDYRDFDSGKLRDHALLDYQTGSIRDTFDFGAAFLVSTDAARHAYQHSSRAADNLKSGSLYDLRLKLSEFSQLIRCPEFLYVRHEPDVGIVASEFLTTSILHNVLFRLRWRRSRRRTSSEKVHTSSPGSKIFLSPT